MPKSKGEIDWVKALDFKAALVTLHYEFQGDWYRDPWSWPELDWIVEEGIDVAIARLNGVHIKKVAKIDVPKENFGTRPAVIMDPVDRLIYQALVDRYSLRLIGSMLPWVFGWRLQPRDPKAGQWSHNELQHSAFRQTLSLAAIENTAALRTDIVSCFASIDLERLCEMVETRCGSTRMTARLNELVLGWGSVVGRSGLAQRSTASAALANMYLEPIDDVLNEHQRRRRRGHNEPPGFRLVEGTRVARWMDDMWVFGKNAGRLRVIQLALQDALRDIGLEINHAKTELLEGSDVVEEVLRIQHSAVDGALRENRPNAEPLLQLIEGLLDKPAKADRTSVKFATVRMRKHKVFGPVPEFAAKANQMTCC